MHVNCGCNRVLAVPKIVTLWGLQCINKLIPVEKCLYSFRFFQVKFSLSNTTDRFHRYESAESKSVSSISAVIKSV